MTTTVLLALLKKLEGKVDSLELISFEPVTELPETGEPNVIYLVPKSDPETGNYSDEYVWDSDNQTYEKIGDTIIYPLPDVTSIDNGKVLGVVDGEWAVYTIPKELPAVSSSDNGKILGVSSGVWTKINPAPNANTNIASVYSSSSTYNKGDLVIYNNTLYECIVSIKTAENWTAAHWEAKTVADEFVGIENEINGCDVYDNTPYNFRTSGGTLEIGDREYDTLVGGTVAFNQLCNMDYSETGISASGTKLTIASTISVGSRNKKVQDLNIPTNHVVLFTMNKKSGTMTGTVQVGMLHTTGTTSWQGAIPLSSANGTTSIIYKSTDTIEALQLFLYSGFTISADFEADFNISDLTQMFGSTIADYIYSLEQATAGSGVAYFRSLFPKDYYAYNAGQLMSVKALSHKMVGFNQWDEEWEVGMIDNSGVPATGVNRIRSKNFIPVLPNTTYYSKNMAWLFFYENNISHTSFIDKVSIVNGTFTVPSTAHYMKFYTASGYGETYNNDICINLHWDGERDGEYEAYSEQIYPLDSDLELRGIPKLDANNQLYYDGDTYESDGTVTRKYAVVDLGTLTYTYNSTYSFFQSSNIAGYGTKHPQGIVPNLLCDIYNPVANGGLSTLGDLPDYSITARNTFAQVSIKDSRYTDPTTFKTAMNGVYLVYELETPTTETADTFTNPQLVDNWGTEEYTDSREVQIPVGHITKYPRGIKSLMAIMEQEIEEAKELPEVSSSDEGKVLMVDSNGNWVAANTPYPLSGNGDTVTNLNTDISVEDVT